MERVAAPRILVLVRTKSRRAQMVVEQRIKAFSAATLSSPSSSSR
jgi:hypothetical protein